MILYTGNFGFQQIWTRHQKLESQPIPLPLQTKGIWDLSKFGLNINSWKDGLPSPPVMHGTI